MSERPHIILIGCGKMGGSLLQGWLDHNIEVNFTVIEPHDISVSNVQHFRSVEDAVPSIKTADIVILAIKPQAMEALCNKLSPYLNANTTILSIAAGQSLKSLSGYFGAKQPIIRTMPNTPAAIGKGITVAIANAHIAQDNKQIADRLLKNAGKVEWVNDESLLDAVTALSGSGPAYVFYLIEILTNAGKKAGLPEKLAETLARETVIGSSALADEEKDVKAEVLRENVTSPGGTTAAALEILMDGRVQELFNEALQVATDRSRELNN